MARPGQTAKVAKTALGVTGAAAPLVGAAIGAAVTGPFAPLGAAIGGLVGLVATLGAGAIDPQRAAAKQRLVRQGYSPAFAAEYARSRKLGPKGLKARAGQLADRGDVEGLQAVRLLLAEDYERNARQAAEIVASTPRQGRVPLWAPVAFLAIVGVGLALFWRRR